MLSGHGSARRRRGRNNRAARIAVPVAAVMALGLTVGIMVGTSGHSAPKLRSAAASGSMGVSSTAVEDTCDIIVPANPLTAKGLATPYQLTGPAGGSPAATGQTAQDNAANAARMPGAKVLVNGSDNALIDNFLDPALGCTPFMAPDLGNRGTMATSQALDELLAARNQPADAALVPENDEMVLDNGGNIDVAKTDLYRAEIGQAPVDSQSNASSSPQMYCQNMVNIQTAFIAANEKVFATWPSPVPTVGDTLYTFLANRLASSFDNLNCKNFGLHQTVTVVLNGAGAATAATLNDDPEVSGF